MSAIQGNPVASGQSKPHHWLITIGTALPVRVVAVMGAVAIAGGAMAWPGFAVRSGEVTPIEFAAPLILGAYGLACFVSVGIRIRHEGAPATGETCGINHPVR